GLKLLPMAIKNLGPYDQKLALQWVQDNSEFFNCDKSKVTRPIFWSVSAELIYRQKNPVASFFKRRMSITYYMLDVDTTLFSGAVSILGRFFFVLISVLTLPSSVLGIRNDYFHTLSSGGEV
ncbi:hypothetical protein J132_08775, partial [Termitomyces sp. J132]